MTALRVAPIPKGSPQLDFQGGPRVTAWRMGDFELSQKFDFDANAGATSGFTQMDDDPFGGGAKGARVRLNSKEGGALGAGVVLLVVGAVMTMGGGGGGGDAAAGAPARPLICFTADEPAYTAARCCVLPTGDDKCWSGAFTYEACCAAPGSHTSTAAGATDVAPAPAPATPAVAPAARPPPPPPPPPPAPTAPAPSPGEVCPRSAPVRHSSDCNATALNGICTLTCLPGYGQRAGAHAEYVCGCATIQLIHQGHSREIRRPFSTLFRLNLLTLTHFRLHIRTGMTARCVSRTSGCRRSCQCPVSTHRRIIAFFFHQVALFREAFFILSAFSVENYGNDPFYLQPAVHTYAHRS